MTLSRAAFERGVRRLDGPAARGFVSDLLGARGYGTTVEGQVVTATSDTKGSMRLLVVADGRSLVTVGRARSFDTVLVTGGPTAAAVGSVAVRAAGRDDRPAVLGAGTLYEWFTYAVDPEVRAALADRYLDATAPTALGRVLAAVADSLPGEVAWLGRGQVPSGRTAVVVVLVALLAVVAAATAGPLGAFGPTATPHAVTGDDDDGETAGITAVPATVTRTPTTMESGGPVPDACPQPPVDAHPASLRPGVIQTASTSGLEGWRVLVTQNLSEYEFDPNDQRARVVPEQQHVVVFETPDRATVRLGIDRWDSPARAEAAVARGGPWELGVPWGAYVLWAESHADRSEWMVRQVLAAVETPGGTRLGGACVSALAAGAETNGTG